MFLIGWITFLFEFGLISYSHLCKLCAPAVNLKVVNEAPSIVWGANFQGKP